MFLYHKRAHGGVVGLAEHFEPFMEGMGRGAQVEQEHLVFAVVDDAIEPGAEAGEFGGVAVAEEHAVLDTVSLAFEQFKGLCAPFVIGDIVADEIVSSRHCAVAFCFVIAW